MWINADLSAITAQDSIVLANNRQVLAFKKTWGLQKGICALPSVFSWQQYLQNTWRNIYPNSQHRFISSIESKACINWCITELGQIVDKQLLDEVVKNINYCYAHLINPEQLSTSHIQHCTAFAAWMQRYQQYKLERGLVDIGDLSTLIINHTADITKPYIYGFKTLTPEQLLLFQHIGYQTLCAKQTNTQSSNLSFNTTHDEILSAARWAKDLQQAQPKKHIAIVSPTLVNDYYQIKSIFDQVFDDVLCETGQKAYNISLGLPLTQYPLIRHILLILQLSQQLARDYISTETFNTTIVSPYIAHARSEQCERALLVNQVLSLAKTHFKLAHIKQYLSTTPHLKTMLDALIVKAVATQQSHKNWLFNFNNYLQIWGFATERTLSSAEYQLFNKYQQSSLGLNQLAGIHNKVSGTTAINDLKNWLSQVIFQAQSSTTTIQILGSLEAEGLYFDAAWVLGMSDNFLPAGLNSPRFIPANIATKHQIPHSNFALIAKDCKHTLNNLINLSAEVICSYAKTHFEGEQRPSPMLVFENQVKTPKLQHKSSKTLLESLTDTQASKLLNKQISGGVSVLKEQMACAFKGFTHRLNIQSFETPHLGLNRAEQGIIIHKILQKIYQQTPSHAHLIAYQPEQLDKLIDTNIKQTLQNYVQSGFTQVEYQRLWRLIHQFIAIEKQRERFKVVATEQIIEANIAGLSFNIRLDRVDELENSECIIFDYKTGNTPSNPWCGTPIKEPQLPIYAISNQVDGVAFISITADKVSYTGLAKDEQSLPNKTAQQKSCGEWNHQVKLWQQQLEQASIDYQQGQAAVLPTKGACQYCQYDSLCRLQK